MRMLDARKTRAIELLMEPELKISDIANECGVSRQTIYDWMKDNEEFRAELDSRRREIKDLGQRMFGSKFAEAVKRYWKLIESTDNTETERKALEYIIERYVGKIPSKTEITDGRDEDKKDQDILDQEFEKWKSEGRESE